MHSKRHRKVKVAGIYEQIKIFVVWFFIRHQSFSSGENVFGEFLYFLLLDIIIHKSTIPSHGRKPCWALSHFPPGPGLGLSPVKATRSSPYSRLSLDGESQHWPLIGPHADPQSPQVRAMNSVQANGSRPGLRRGRRWLPGEREPGRNLMMRNQQPPPIFLYRIILLPQTSASSFILFLFFLFSCPTEW